MKNTDEYKVTVEQKDGTTDKHLITIDARRPPYPQIEGFVKQHYGRSKMLVRSVDWEKYEGDETSQL